MLQQSTDFENSRDHNWRRLWETPSKKSQRRYARAWVHPLLGDLPISEALAIPKHPVNPVNLAPEDKFLLWFQEIEAKQEEQAQQMAELHEHANRLLEENGRLRTRFEVGKAEQSREPTLPFPPSRPRKGKEVAASDDIDLPTDDELSSESSPLHRRSPSMNAVEAKSRKKAHRRSSRSISVARRWVLKEPSRDKRPLSQLTSMCLTGLGASPLQYHPCTHPSGSPPLRN